MPAKSASSKLLARMACSYRPVGWMALFPSTLQNLLFVPMRRQQLALELRRFLQLNCPWF